MNDTLSDIEYWITKLEEDRDKLRVTRDLYNKDQFGLPYEELYKLISDMTYTCAHVDLLRDSFTSFTAPKPSFWKKLFRK